MSTKSLSLLLTLLAGGCIVQSFHPFYTDASKTAMPALTGQWNLVRVGDESVEEKYTTPWTFEADSILTHDEKTKSGKLDVTYFKVKGTNFADLTAAEPPNEPSAFWTIHIIPVHSVCKVELDADTLVMRPLNLKWLDAAVDAKAISLPFFLQEKDHRVYTAEPEAWQKLLALHAANTNAFPDDIAYTFKRHSAPSPSQPSTPLPKDSPPQ